MAAFLFRCPINGMKVQGWQAETPASSQYEAIECTACGLTHLVNPLTGEVIGATSSDTASSNQNC